jgi:hypothetical protein
VQPGRVERERDPVARADVRLLLDLGGEERAAVGGEQRRALSFVRGRTNGFDVDCRRVDGEEHVRRRPQLLDDHGLDLEQRQPRRSRPRVREVLRPDAEDEPPVVGAGGTTIGVERDPEAGELDCVAVHRRLDEVHRG